MAVSLIEKILTPGTKVEIQKKTNEKAFDGTDFIKTYTTRVSEVKEDGMVEAYMPLDHTRLVLLPLEKEFDMFCYAPDGIYECRVAIRDRYKVGNVYLMLLEVISEMKKNQRRNYYRLRCSLEMHDRKLTPEEVTVLQSDKPLELVDEPKNLSIIADISGGGLRFVSAGEAYQKGEFVYTVFHFGKEYRLFASVVSANKVEKQPELTEYRARFVGIGQGEREDIIRHIFELERALRRSGK